MEDTAVANKVLTPALRFPAFHEGWKRSKLGTASDFVTSGSRDWAQYYAPEGDLFIRMTNLPKEGITLDLSDVKYVRLPEGGTDGNRTNLKAGDILISITAELGKIGWVPAEVEGAFINQHTALVRTKSSVDSEFIAHHLSTFKTNKVINRLNDSGAKSGLNLPTVKSIPLTLPTLPEQQKIAAFLGAVDRKIQQLKRKQALLELYKKGVVQQLFPSAGSGQAPELRFKREDGSEYPKWEEKKLGELAYITTGTSNRVDSSLDAPYTFFDRSVDVRRSNIFLYDTEAIIVGGEGQEFIPKHFIGKFDLHQRAYAIMNFKGATGPFLFQYIDKHRAYFLSQAVGSTVKSLRLPMFTGMPISLPSLEEQSRIAGFLMALDAKVAGVAQAVAAAEKWKKGLLQQMFV